MHSARALHLQLRALGDLPPILRDQVAHFFQHYKDVEKGKWTTIDNWVDAAGAETLIMEAIARASR